MNFLLSYLFDILIKSGLVCDKIRHTFLSNFINKVHFDKVLRTLCPLAIGDRIFLHADRKLT